MLPGTAQNNHVSKRRKLGISNETDHEASSVNPRIQLTCNDYTIGWICALPVELVGAKAMLDVEHISPTIAATDKNVYCLGSIHGHNVAIVCLAIGRYGTTSAAVAAEHMMATFKSITSVLMVGIGGAAPRPGYDIRLGDVVISTPSSEDQAVIQYDFGKTVAGGRFESKGVLNKPKSHLLQAVAQMKAEHQLNQGEIPQYISNIPDNFSSNPGSDHDVFFSPVCESGCQCVHDPPCSESGVFPRELRSNSHPKVHYGTIASGNQVIKDGTTRNRLAIKFNALCFEMEAAGLMDEHQPLVIRGLSDYCDSSKNKHLQGYAAATAAAVAKELLSFISVKVTATNTVKSASKVADHRQKMMELLDFAESGSRRATVKRAHSKTCRWILQKTEYLQWLDATRLDEHHGLLWIKGNPGTGKSTIMKFVLEQMQYRKVRETDIIVISFFFNARGHDLERSLIGMYRSLLHQLLTALPRMQELLDHIPEERVSVMTLEHFEGLIARALELLKPHHLICLVDALDECPEQQARQMVRFFEEIGELTCSRRLSIQVLFASRHYPNISIKKCQTLILDEQVGHSQDLIEYIEAELKIGAHKQSNEIKKQLLRKSNKIFLWVVLVVRILQTEYDRGRVQGLQKKLDDLPPELNDLFRDILSRDKHRLPEFVLCMQWILYSARPLHRAEFYFALLAGNTSEELLPWEFKYVTAEVMDNFLLDASKGLAEMTRGTVDPTVQFIHESVREFLLRPEALAHLHEDLRNFSVGLSHERLKKCCERQVISAQATLLKLRWGAHCSLDMAGPAQVRSQMDWTYPFLAYAIEFVLAHADHADAAGIPQYNYADKLFRSSWLKWNNLLQSPGLGLIDPESEVSFILFLAIRDFGRLLTLQLQKSEISTEVFKPIMQALIDNQIISRYYQVDAGVLLLKIYYKSLGSENSDFIEPLVKLLLAHGHFEWSSQRSTVCRDRDDLISTVLGWHNTIPQLMLDRALAIAAFFGETRAAMVLCNKGAAVNSRDQHGRTPLHEAAWNGMRFVAEYLLSQGADIDSQDHYLTTPLFHAAKYGDSLVVELLCKKGATIDAQNLYQETPLFVAVQVEGAGQVVDFLCNNGADVNHQDAAGNTPLFYASKKSEVQLLMHGANPNIRNKHGKMTLHRHVEHADLGRIRLLVQYGAQSDLFDSNGNTPLHVISMVYKMEWQHDWIFSLFTLLSHTTSDINRVNARGHTALHYTIRNGASTLSRILYDHGAIVSDTFIDSMNEPHLRKTIRVLQQSSRRNPCCRLAAG